MGESYCRLNQLQKMYCCDAAFVMLPSWESVYSADLSS